MSAFTALGGNPDRSGYVSIEKIEQICNALGLIVNLKRFQEEYDEDNNGVLDFDEFTIFLSDNDIKPSSIKPP